ncbi:8-amino-7-oxononanoate synthase [Methyloversatilis sp. XJ19-49]|uniref:8-amino-7-oxononanoate synthase n=1 Tax=Methyloversatilis sp. XJ19-49 TaxID=2963429 RepID=UPI00211CF88A|nr:8-amino-7-oxononanoate synthase [Methyloversatilis sp. XJ19-49]MCQ9378918.1 8-amino-7-oxononanoate synthase [Methyloversatilis sp. XJ19-49]
MSAFDFRARLAALARDDLTRTRGVLDAPCGPEAVVDGQRLIAFAGNDYLGLANHPEVVEALREGASRWGAGAGASHLVSGHQRPHEALEQALAAFTGLARALFFSTGYMANLALLPALAGRGDTLIADRLNHASLVDAALLSRATVRRYPHGDLAAVARMLDAAQGRKVVVTDGVFSMDGDIAPLAELLALCERHDALLVVDDAHGFGVLGEQGRGVLSHCGLASERIVYIGTLGKAAGVAGAFVAGGTDLIEWLMQTGRSYRYTTAAPPALACALMASLGLIGEADDRRATLAAHRERLQRGLTGARWTLMPSHTAIQPLHVGTNAAVLALAGQLRAHGLWVPAIRPPTVPSGTARLRISLSAAHTAGHLDALCHALSEAGHD